MAVRRSLLSAGFLGAVLLLAGPGPARAQLLGGNSPGKHTPLPGVLTPDQVRRALEPFALPPGFPPELVDDLRRKLQHEQGLDPRVAEATLQKLLSDPAIRQRLEEAAKQQKGGGPPLPLGELDRLRKNLPDFLKAPPAGPPPAGERPHPPFPGDGPPPGAPKTELPPVGARPPLLPPAGRGGLPPFPKDVLRPPGRGWPRIPLPPPPPRPEGSVPFSPNETPRDRAARTFASAWERNIGPLDDTPAVKQAIFELAAGMEDFKTADGKNVWDELAKETAGSASFADLIDQAALGDSWSMPKLDLPSFNWSRSADGGHDGGGAGSSSGGSWWNRRSSSPRTGGSSSGGGGFGLPGLEGSWAPVVLLVVLLVGGFLVWRFWLRAAPGAGPGFGRGGPGAWPVDPHRIATRRDVVRAFEYLSVLVCGPVARTWTHTTVAAALADLAATHGDTAVLLARLYELARYTPADEPLTTAELAEARRLVCRLAGLEDE